MTLDRRGEEAARALEGHLNGVSTSRADLDARRQVVQRRRMRTALAAFVVLVLIAVPAVLLGSSDERGTRANPGGGEPPIGTLTSGAWSSVPVATSGLGVDSSVSALASTTDGVVAVGSRQVGGSDLRAAWFSEDGLTWSVADGPDGEGALTAVGVHGTTVLAVGSDRTGGPADIVWRSTDGGRSWRDVAEGTDTFGAPAPEMGRPFVTDLVWLDGRWVAGGGASDGLGGAWVSDDGATWNPTFPANRIGGPDLAARPDGSLLAYWVDEAWTTTDGLTWSPQQPSLPPGYGLQSVADGAAVAVASATGADSPYITPTPLLRSTDGGLTWAPDPSFLAAAPEATAWVVDVVGDVLVVGGSGAGQARPAAWASTGAGSWVGLPPVLTEGQEGGGVVLTAAVGSNVVLMAGGPVAVTPGGAAPPTPSRYFVLHAGQLPGSTAGTS